MSSISRPNRRWRVSLLATVVVAATLGMPSAAALAAPGDVGFVGPVYTGASNPTEHKPESKLWFNDGSWWGSLYDSVAKKYMIHRLDAATQSWQKTGVLIDNRASSHSDALWDGTKLYIASHSYSSTPAVGFPARLYRYSYDSGSKTYSLDPGFPVTINDYKTETLVIAKDGTGTLWATWTEGNKVWVNRTVGSDLTWGTPFVPAINGASNLKADDISSIIAFGPGKIGLMWSNQNAPAMYFAVHADGAADTAWTGETALSGAKSADDHINMKSIESDGSGRVFAITKTSQTTSTAAIITVLSRTSSGSWSDHPVWRVSDGTTRPILLIDAEHQELRAFATAPDSGGIVYTKRSPLNGISFPLGKGDIFIRDAAVDGLNNPTTTKQNVSSATGLVVLAAQNVNKTYWHNVDPLGGGGPPPPSAPLADFTSTATSGPAPLAVTFTDTSSGNPTSWSWAFGDGATSGAQNPSHTYSAAGTYTVSLTAGNAAGSNTMTRTGYVTVTAPPPPGSTLTFTPVADAHTKSSSPTSNYGTDPTLRVRDGSPVYNPYLKFDVAGLSAAVSSVTLRVYVATGSNDGGSVYGVGNGWTETGLTWNNAPAIGGPALAVLGKTTTGTWVDLPLGAGAVPANGSYSFAIHNASSSSGYFSSREGTNPAQLIVALAGGPPVTPSADFNAAPTSGVAPLPVAFTDTSSGAPTSWSWSFGDGTTSTAQSPSHTYAAAGTYTVSLTATNAGGSDTRTKTGLITVGTPPPPGSGLTFDAVADAHVKSTSPTSNYGSDTTLRVRDGSSDGTATYRPYLKFDVTGITGTVASVTLRIFVVTQTNDGGGVYPVSAGWAESSLTWNNAPPPGSPALAAIGPTTTGTWITVPLGAAALSGNGSYAFAIANASKTSGYFGSREGGTAAQLLVTLAP